MDAAIIVALLALAGTIGNIGLTYSLNARSERRREQERSDARVAAELERHSRRSAYQADGDLVFGHPETGEPLDRSRLLKRLKRDELPDEGPTTGTPHHARVQT